MNEIGPTILHVDGVPTFVVLRYDEYQRLLKLASASPTPPSDFANSTVGGEVPRAQDDLTTSAFDVDGLVVSDQQKRALIPHNGLIPHEVVAAAVHNHWSLVRAWREFFGLTQQVMAERMGVSVLAYTTMETEFSRLPPLSKERLAEALGIGLDQLVTRRRRPRNADYE